MNKFDYLIQFILDKKKSIKYSIYKNELNFNENFSENLIIINDFSGYGNCRKKNYRGHEYFCTRNKIIEIIKNVSCDVILVISSDINNKDNIINILELFEQYCKVILITNNVGQDIGSYAAGIKFCKDKKITYKSICLLNTSQYLSSTELLGFINYPVDKNEMLGISYGIGPKFNLIKHVHLQTYALKGDFFQISNIFQIICPDLKFYNSKYRIILYGEVAISKIALLMNIKLFILFLNSKISIENKISLSHYDHRDKFFIDNHLNIKN
ncbi:hypothetical protein [Polynucleobacter aenigmaticus]|nr:hypothetical protein [Polynucleobacter aenigmaticus]